MGSTRRDAAIIGTGRFDVNAQMDLLNSKFMATIMPFRKPL
jgi:hypothetical protein